MNGGRPLRFLLMLLGGWAAARGIDLYNGDAAALPGWIAPIAKAVAAFGSTPAAAVTMPGAVARRPRPAPQAAAAAWIRFRPPPAQTASAPPAPPPAPAEAVPPQQAPAAPLLSPAVLPPVIARAGSRLAGSAWLIVRNGSSPGIPGSQLGASQGGARITYALGSGRRLALAARVSAPLSGRGKEAAVGLDWQPLRAPIHVLVEQRFALDGGRGGTMIGVVGGFGPVAIVRGVQLEGYGQAGVIARDAGEGFIDGAVRAAHPLPAIGALRIDVGAGVWGGAQQGASRLDIGPSLGVVVPVGRGSIRITADWRERIAGESHPDSGPAVSLGTNF